MQLEIQTFEQWLRYVFDHPVPEDRSKAWYWDTDQDWWDADDHPARDGICVRAVDLRVAPILQVGIGLPYGARTSRMRQSSAR